MSEEGKFYVLSRPGIMAFGKYLPCECCLSLLGTSESVTQMSSWGRLSAAVCSSGRAYTFGQSDYFAWMKKDRICDPSLVVSLANITIVQVACGGNLALFLSNRGEVFSCGSNDSGQLGLGHRVHVSQPSLVLGPPPVRTVSAGSEHTALLAVNGDVWVSGRNNMGQLGLGNCISQSCYVRVPDLPDTVEDVQCGSWHTLLLTTSKMLLATGRNKDHELALPADVEVAYSFQSVAQACKPVATVVCGYSHTLVLSEDGTVRAWGRNNVGQLGIGKDDKVSSSLAEVPGLEGTDVIGVFAGGNHSALVTKEGEVLVCGHGKLGELGLEKEDFTVPTTVSKALELVVQQVVFAQEYTLFLVASKYATVPMDVGGYVTMWERSLARFLKCPVCSKLMCAPIHQCFKGHNLCGSCFSQLDTLECPSCQQPFIPGKNLALEGLAAEVHLPCGDCLVRMSVPQLAKHVSLCPSRQYTCPLQQPCSWSGRLEYMLAHAVATHPALTWRDLPHVFYHNPSDKLFHTELIAANNEVFTLHRRYNEEDNNFQVAVRYLGLPENSTNFRFRLEFNADSDDWNISVSKKVSSDLQDFQEIFQFLFCASINNDIITNNCTKNDNLPCRVSVFEAEKKCN